jgi:hypothetical protein
MTLAFKAALPTTQKFVLVALCDAANDQGECYPSVSSLREKCSMGERTVQDALHSLERAGFIRREFRPGRSTVYWLDPRSSRTPAAAAPPRQPHPAPAVAAPPPPQQPHHTPAAAAPITVNEPSIEPSRNQKKREPAVVGLGTLVEAGFDAQTADDFIAHKSSVKAPLTDRAWKDHLRESEKAGWSPVDAAEKVMAKNWKGFEAKYVAGESRQGAGPPMSKQAALEARNAAVIREFMEEQGEAH